MISQLYTVIENKNNLLNVIPVSHTPINTNTFQVYHDVVFDRRTRANNDAKENMENPNFKFKKSVIVAIFICQVFFYIQIDIKP